MTLRFYKTHGIVLKRQDFGEADRLITFFTKEYGKIKVLAKGVRKITSRRAGHLEVFEETKCTLYQGKTFDTVTEVTRINTTQFPRENLATVSYAYYLCELVDLLLPERQEHTDIYEVFQYSLLSLMTAENQRSMDMIVSQAALEFLRVLGYLPENRTIPSDSLHHYIESITERKLRTPVLLSRLS